MSLLLTTTPLCSSITYSYSKAFNGALSYIFHLFIYINFQIYNKWFSEFITEIPLIYFVYIKTEPKIAHERVLKRNRKGENISVEYLEMCSMYHDNWLIENCVRNCIVINGNEVSSRTFEKTNEIVSSFIS